MDNYLFWFWVLGIVLGAVIGESKGKLVWGFLLGLLFGLVGALLALFLPNAKKEKKEKQQSDALQQQIRLQQATLEQMQKMAHPTPAPTPTPRIITPVARLRLSKGAEDLGEIDITSAKLLIKTGTPIEEMHYLNQQDEWRPLSEHKAFQHYKK